MSERLQCLLVFAIVSAACPPVFAETRYVSKTGRNEPPYTTPETAAKTIQAALDACFTSDVVRVGPGEYDESVTIRQDGIILLGAGRDQSRIIVPDDEDSVGIAAEGYGLEIHGLAVVGGKVGVSLGAEFGPVLITDCLIEKAKEVGLSIGERGTVHVVDSVFRGAETGIHVRWHDEEYLYSQLYVFGSEFLDNGTGIYGSNVCVVSATECSFLRNGYGIYGGWGAVILVDSCRFGEGTSGVVAMTADGVVRVSDSVFTFMLYEAIETDQRGLITDCLFYANDRAFDEWDGGYVPDFVRCTFVSNRIALGRMPEVVRECIFWNNGEDLPEAIYWGLPQAIIEHCLINDPRFAGSNGNVSGNPRFVGWGAFNESDYPMHVVSSVPPGGDGSLKRPFGSLKDAILSFDFRLCEGSPCLGAGALGGHLGYPAGIAASDTPRSDHVAIEVGPGEYCQRSLVIPPRTRIYAKSGPSEKPRLLAEEVHVQKAASLSRIDFQGGSVYADSPSLYDCEFRQSFLCLDGGSAAWCKVLGAGTYIGYGSSSAKLSNCVLARSGDFPVLVVPYPQEPVELTNCTVVGRHAMDVSQYPVAVCANLINCIVSGLVSGPTDLIQARHSLFSEHWPGEGNIAGAPMFVDAENGDFRLRADSPCIDAGFNDPQLPETDIAGMHRIMFGGESLSVDMGAYEFYINEAKPIPGAGEAIFTWSSLADKTYSIFYSDDLLTWHLAVQNFPSAGNETTSWSDDGTLTGVPPSLAPRRFYRVSENGGAMACIIDKPHNGEFGQR